MKRGKRFRLRRDNLPTSICRLLLAASHQNGSIFKQWPQLCRGISPTMELGTSSNVNKAPLLSQTHSPPFTGSWPTKSLPISPLFSGRSCEEMIRNVMNLIPNPKTHFMWARKMQRSDPYPSRVCQKGYVMWYGEAISFFVGSQILMSRLHPGREHENVHVSIHVWITHASLSRRLYFLSNGCVSLDRNSS